LNKRIETSENCSLYFAAATGAALTAVDPSSFPNDRSCQNCSYYARDDKSALVFGKTENQMFAGNDWYPGCRAVCGCSVADVAVKTATIGFESNCFDLESGVTTSGSGFGQECGEGDSSAWDINFAYNAATAPHHRLWFNEQRGDISFVETANAFATTLSVEGLVFCDYINDPVNDCNYQDKPLRDGYIGVVRTGNGNYFKIGFIEETTSSVKFKYQKISAP
jgi:hypothetical protein